MRMIRMPVPRANGNDLAIRTGLRITAVQYDDLGMAGQTQINQMLRHNRPQHGDGLQ